MGGVQDPRSSYRTHVEGGQTRHRTRLADVLVAITLVSLSDRFALLELLSTNQVKCQPRASSEKVYIERRGHVIGRPIELIGKEEGYLRPIRRRHP
jgi:hypothetical protein